MKAAAAFLTTLFLFVVSALPASAQTRTVRHPVTGSPAITVTVPDGWASSLDPDNNLILTSSPHATAFSLSVVEDDPAYTVDGFARAVLKVVNADAIRADGEDMLPPIVGSRYLATMKVNDQLLNLKLVLVQVEPGWFATATLVSLPAASAEQMAVADMMLKTVRVVR